MKCSGKRIHGSLFNNVEDFGKKGMNETFILHSEHGEKNVNLIPWKWHGIS